MIDLSKLKTASQKAKEVFDAEYSQKEKLRQAAYIEESDPLFFKYQRGTATKEEWLDKVEEIKVRFPYPTEA